MNRRAFTLLETIIALSVFAIAVVGCLQAIQAIAGAVADLRMESIARRSLENHAAKIRGLRNFPSSQPIESAPLPGGITIKDEIDPVVDAEAGIDNASRLLQVRMIAGWNSRDGRQAITNTIYMRGTD